MTDENTDAAGPRSLSLDEAVAALQESRQPKEEAEPEQPEPETATAEPDAEAEEFTDEVPAEEVEIDETDDESEHPDAEVDDDAEPEEDEDEALYEVEGETFTLSDLQEWKKSGLRQADYTKKNQALARDRETFVQEREAFEVEKASEIQAMQQQRDVLRDTLAQFAIEQTEPPKRADYASTDDYIVAQERYAADQDRKAQAQQTYQALVAQETQATRQREAAKAMQYFPEWATDEGFNSAVQSMTAVGSEFGFTQDEIVNGGLQDHRTFRVLNELVQLREQVGDRNARRKAQAKKVAKATKRLTPGSKPTETASQVEQRKARKRLSQTGSVNDAVAALRARRKG